MVVIVKTQRKSKSMCGNWWRMFEELEIANEKSVTDYVKSNSDR